MNPGKLQLAILAILKSNVLFAQIAVQATSISIYAYLIKMYIT